jgi:hypothetical protein
VRGRQPKRGWSGNDLDEIAPPHCLAQGLDYVDPAFGTAITAGIGERQNGFDGLFAQLQRAKSAITAPGK